MRTNRQTEAAQTLHGGGNNPNEVIFLFKNINADQSEVIITIEYKERCIHQTI